MSRQVPTYGQFITEYTSFGNVDPAAVKSALDFSSQILDGDAWGDFYSQAICLDVAHNLTIDVLNGTGASGAMQGAAGPISSVSGAGISTSFNTVSLSDPREALLWYSKTSYGQKFLRLQSAVISAGFLSA